MIEHEVEPYSVLEVQQLIEAATRERNGVRWVLALVLGHRQGEALGLKWDDIDWTTGCGPAETHQSSRIETTFEITTKTLAFTLRRG